MRIHVKIQNVVLVVLVAAAIGASALADAALLQPVQSGEATYVSGGVGNEERQELAASEKDYNLKITNADGDGHFTLGTDLVISSKDGHEVIKAANTGPLFYAKLPAGAYVVKASNGARDVVKNIKITGDTPPVKVELVWLPVSG